MLHLRNLKAVAIWPKKKGIQIILAEVSHKLHFVTKVTSYTKKKRKC